MLKRDVIAYFGSATAAARALEISISAVSQWQELIPEGSAYKIQVVTNGSLQVDPAMYRDRDYVRPTG